MALAIPIPRRPVMPALTGLRAFTATNIVFFHFWNPAWFGPLAPMMDNGYVGVNFFFLLSGFILTYNYADRSGCRPIQPQPVLADSVFRGCIRSMLLGLLISFPILELEWRYRTHANFFLGLSLTTIMQQGWSPKLATFWNTPAWTLSCESRFSTCCFRCWWRSSGRGNARKLLLILAGVLAGVPGASHDLHVAAARWPGPDHPHVQQLLAARGETDAAAASAVRSPLASCSPG